MAEKNSANIGFEKQIWDAACVLRGNMDALRSTAPVSFEVELNHVKNYLAFYVIDDEKQIIHMIRFLYGKRDWLPILRGGYSLD